MKALWAASILLGFVGPAVQAQNYPPQGYPNQGYPPQGYPQANTQGYPQNPGYPQNTPPNPSDSGIDADSAAHGVGRLSLMNGTVSVAHGDDGQMAGAVVNAPLVTSDRLLTGADGRAEIELDGANVVRAGASTELRMGDLQYKRFQVQIAQGTVTYRVLRDNDAQVEISTPTVAVHPLRQGTYRVTVTPDGLTEVTVRAGEAEVASQTGSEQLRSGQTMQSRGSPSDPEFRTTNAPALDDWDRWNEARDRVFENQESARYVPSDVYGAEDLGSYGRWSYDPAYGNVWIPNEPPDWAPYQDGQWTDENYYGWTWIGYEPWGWAPYHYGRWYRGAYGWAWYPGALGARYAWRPAMVGFFGWGSPGFGVSLGFGFANVGWVPLAPFEAFHPWYGRGYGFRNAVLVNNTNIASVYRNARVAGAVTSMRAGEFGRTAVTRSNMVRASAGDLSHVSMMRGGVPVAASRESRVFGAATGSMRGMPNSNANTHFFSSAYTRTAGSSPAANGGWKRFDASSSRIGTTPGGFQRPTGGGFQNGSSYTRSGGFQSAPSAGFRGSSTGASQAVRIAPPIVTNRSQGYAAPQRGSVPYSGGFGGPRSSPSGGGVRSAPSGGARSSGGRSGGARR